MVKGTKTGGRKNWYSKQIDKRIKIRIKKYITSRN